MLNTSVFPSLPCTRAPNLLSPLAYSPEQALFLLDDQSIGFAFLVQPLASADPAVAERVNVLLNHEWPADTLMQYCLFASPDIQQPLLTMQGLRRHSSSPLLQEATTTRARFLSQASHTPLNGETYLRDFQLLLCVKLPLARQTPSASDIEAAARRQVSVAQSLATIGFSAQRLDHDGYVQWMSCLLNWQPDASWRHPTPLRADDDKPLREQVFDTNTPLRVSRDGLQLGEQQVVTLSCKRFPDQLPFGVAAHFAGDAMTGSRGIRQPFLLTVSVHFPKQDRTRANLDTKRQWAVNQAYGPMLKFIPLLAAKKRGFDVLFDALQQGDSVVKANMTLTLFAQSDEEATAASASARTYFKELGFTLMEDKFFCLPIFLNALPFGADRHAIQDLFRYRTFATRHVIPLLPLFADWKGTGTPMLQLVSRQGQLMPLSLFDSDSNYNACIAAQSGAGKSFFVNELISSYLSAGGQCWVIDVGRSYEKLCAVYDGQFMQFGRDSQLCLNPFDIVQDYDEEADVIVGLLAAMAAPTEQLTDYQMAQLKRVTQQLWQTHGNALTVDMVADALVGENDQRIIDIGAQLYPFTRHGEYGRFFFGKNNLRLDHPFMVLELEELKGRKHLQQVVLLQLIYQIQQEMYLGIRNRPKIVFIDEAWDLLTQGDVAKFIETGYRRFRKYGGSAVTVTQSVNDLYDSPTGKAIAENSANMYLLGQKTETVNTLQQQGRLPLTEAGYQRLKTVHTLASKYSEVFVMSERGANIGRLYVDPFHQLLYSTKPDDINAIDRWLQQGLPLVDAIHCVLQERQPDSVIGESVMPNGGPSQGAANDER